MKVASLHLRRFKRFEDKLLDLTDPETGLAKDLVVLIGDNGAGKSTILQAIAATVGPATLRVQTPSEVEWPGFSPERAGAAWTAGPEVEVTLELGRDEIDATLEYFQSARDLRPEGDLNVEPSRERIVKLLLRDGKVTSTSPSAYVQCRGREYARQIVRAHPDGHNLFRRVGQIFWYTEQRTAASMHAEPDARGQAGKLDLSLVRRRLRDWYYFHRDVELGAIQLRPGQRDIYVDIQQAYSAVFPGRRLAGPAPRTDAIDVLEEPWFLFGEGDRMYELSEMSGGERAVFPLLLDFAAWNVHRSIVLIDELELHLHPPMQQALIRALGRLGSDNQFILTTHSDAIVDVVPEAAIVRVADLVELRALLSSTKLA